MTRALVAIGDWLASGGYATRGLSNIQDVQHRRRLATRLERPDGTSRLASRAGMALQRSVLPSTYHTIKLRGYDWIRRRGFQLLDAWAFKFPCQECIARAPTLRDPPFGTVSWRTFLRAGSWQLAPVLTALASSKYDCSSARNSIHTCISDCHCGCKRKSTCN